MSTGLKGRSTESIIEQFWGDISRWPIEPDGVNGYTQPLIRQVAERMSQTGDCLWHATSVVTNMECHCANCTGENNRPRTGTVSHV
jgi:hypothetical protein